MARSAAQITTLPTVVNATDLQRFHQLLCSWDKTLRGLHLIHARFLEWRGIVLLGFGCVGCCCWVVWLTRVMINDSDVLLSSGVP